MPQMYYFTWFGHFDFHKMYLLVSTFCCCFFSFLPFPNSKRLFYNCNPVLFSFCYFDSQSQYNIMCNRMALYFILHKFLFFIFCINVLVYITVKMNGLKSNVWCWCQIILFLFGFTKYMYILRWLFYKIEKPLWSICRIVIWNKKYK